MNLIPPWLVAIVAFAAGAALSGGVARNHYLVEIADIQADQDKAVVAAYQSGIARLQAEKVRGDRLSADLAATESALNNKSLEVTHVLSLLTTGRPCLGADVVRVLNHAAAHGPAAVPEAAGTPVAADAAVATDSDVAGWIAAAWGQYETCRARLGALISFEQQGETP